MFRNMCEKKKERKKERKKEIIVLRVIGETSYLILKSFFVFNNKTFHLHLRNNLTSWHRQQNH